MPISTQNGKYIYNGVAYNTLQEAKMAEMQGSRTTINPNIPAGSSTPIQPVPFPQVRQPMSDQSMGAALNKMRMQGGMNAMQDARQNKQYGGRGEVSMPVKPQGLLDIPQQPQQPAQAPSFMDKLTSSDGLTSIGSLMLSMSQDPSLQRIGAMGMQQAMQNRQSNRTLDFLKAKGVDEATINALRDNPQMISAYAASLLKDPKSAQSTVGKIMADYESGAYGKVGSPEALAMRKQAIEMASKSGQPIVIGGTNETEMQKKMAGKRADTISSYFDKGDAAASLMPEIDNLEALSKLAPHGALTGRFLEMFPEATDASAAFYSMVGRIAPTLRVEGSGSTSDIEFKKMLDSLGSLRNSPEANSMIYDAFRKRAQLDMDRAEVAGMYERGDIDYREAGRRWAELNRRSVLSSDLKKMLPEDGSGTAGGSHAGVKPAWMSQDVWDIMSPTEKARFK